MKQFTLKSGLRKLSWLPIVTGIISLGLGIWCLCSPVTSLEVFAYVFAGCLCAAGVLNLCLAFGNSSVGWNWGWALALGMLELICGVWLFTLPAIVLTTAFVFFVGVWIIVAAINALCEMMVLSSYSTGWTVVSVLLLVATIILAIIFMTNPISGGIAVWLYIGLSLILFGIYRFVFAASMRNISKAADDIIL